MNFKTTILATLLVLGASGFLSAQTKYDLAVVAYYRDVPDPLILISLNGEKFQQITVQKEELNGKTWGISMNPLITQVNKLQNEGWVVEGGMIASGLPNQSMFYYNLKKKRE